MAHYYEVTRLTPFRCGPIQNQTSMKNGILRASRNGQAQPQLTLANIKPGPMSERQWDVIKGMTRFERRVMAKTLRSWASEVLARPPEPKPIITSAIINYGDDYKPDALVVKKGKLFIVDGRGAHTPCTLKESISWRIRKQNGNDGSTSTHADEIAWFKMLSGAIA
jgi:hypothetical protein